MVTKPDAPADTAIVQDEGSYYRLRGDIEERGNCAYVQGGQHDDVDPIRLTILEIDFDDCGIAHLAEDESPTVRLTAVSQGGCNSCVIPS